MVSLKWLGLEATLSFKSMQMEEKYLDELSNTIAMDGTSSLQITIMTNSSKEKKNILPYVMHVFAPGIDAIVWSYRVENYMYYFSEECGSVLKRQGANNGSVMSLNLNFLRAIERGAENTLEVKNMPL